VECLRREHYRLAGCPGQITPASIAGMDRDAFRRFMYSCLELCRELHKGSEAARTLLARGRGSRCRRTSSVMDSPTRPAVRDLLGETPQPTLLPSMKRFKLAFDMVGLVRRSSTSILEILRSRAPPSSSAHSVPRNRWAKLTKWFEGQYCELRLSGRGTRTIRVTPCCDSSVFRPYPTRLR